ncbi:MAG: CotH kinase family protein [Faecousia sp.]
MRRRVLLIVFSCVLLVLCAAGVDWAKTRGAAPTPVPSVPGGYYEDAFVLYLDAPPFGQIYYTTDGSEPTTDATLYTDGIRIQNRSQEPNVYTSIQNVVTDWKTFIPDPTPVDKGTVIRAVYVNDWGVQSEILTQTYFVGVPEPQNGYTLSIIFEYDDLFGDDGIYVTGKEYDTWYLSEAQTQPAPTPNFNKRMEVTAIAEMLDTDGEVLNQPVELRIQGSSMRGWIKKRFILESKTALSNSSTYPTDIFEGVSTHSVMTKECLTDAMAFELVSNRAVSTQKSVPVRVFLNGEHWYDTYLLERYDKQYFREYYDVDDVLLVKNGQPDEDVIEDIDSYGEFMYWAGHTDFSDEAEWEQLQKEMDVQSYIDYIVTNYYLCNWDFSDDKNYIVWRSLNEGDSPYADKRWRWCIYDVDALEFTLANYDVENAAEVNIFSCDLPYSDVRVNETILFHALTQNEAFRQQFTLSFMDMVNNNFSPARVESILAKHGHTLDWVDGYFRKRPAYAVEHLAEEFGLTGSLETVAVYTANPEMGDVMVNTSQIDLTSGSWSGQYFTDYPITVTASAKEGYQFVGWKGGADTAEKTLSLSVGGGITLEAVFAKEK